jgi:hypothetical protein
LAVSVGAVAYTQIGESLRFYLLPISLGSLAVASLCTVYLLIYHTFLLPRKLAEIRQRFVDAKSDSSKSQNPENIPEIEAKTLEEKVDLLLMKFEESQQGREKERVLSKIDGLYTLLITLSTFIIGIVVSQRAVIELNVLLLFPLIGIVVVMIVSFSLGVKGMIRNSMEHRMLAYCLLISLPIWYVAIPVLVIMSPLLKTFELQIATLLTGLILSVITILLSRKFTNWFINQFPYLFEGEEKICAKIVRKTITYIVIILAVTLVLTMIIFFVSFQSFISDLIKNQPIPTSSPTPTPAPTTTPRLTS